MSQKQSAVEMTLGRETIRLFVNSALVYVYLLDYRKRVVGEPVTIPESKSTPEEALAHLIEVAKQMEMEFDTKEVIDLVLNTVAQLEPPASTHVISIFHDAAPGLH